MIDLQELLTKIKPYVLGWSGGYAYGTWTITFGGFSSAPTGYSDFWIRHGLMCFISVGLPNNGTSNATTFTISLPFTADTITGMQWSLEVGQGVDNGAVLTAPTMALISSAGTVINLYKDYAGNPWTNSGNKRVTSVCGWYKVAG